MKTKLPTEITEIWQAEKFLTDLHNNGEAYHPEDDAHELSGDLFTPEEATQLNRLMADIYNLPGNENAQTMVFCPCGFLLNLADETKTEGLRNSTPVFTIYKEGRTTNGPVTIRRPNGEPFDLEGKINFYKELGYTVKTLQA